MTGFKRLSGLSDVDVDNFCDAERAHMKENIVAVVRRTQPPIHIILLYDLLSIYTLG